VLQDMIDRLIDIGTRYGMEMIVDKTTIPNTDYETKITEECGLFQPYRLLGATFTCESELYAIPQCTKRLYVWIYSLRA